MAMLLAVRILGNISHYSDFDWFNGHTSVMVIGLDTAKSPEGYFFQKNPWRMYKRKNACRGQVKLRFNLRRVV